MKKWIISAVGLMLLFAVFSLTISAQATEPAVVDSGTCGENLTWVLTDDGTLTISGTGAMTDYQYVEFPEYGEGAYSTNIPWYGKNITTVVFGDGVTHIGDFAVFDCPGLISVTVPDSVTSIGEGAFAWSTSLECFDMPDSVTSVGEQVFWFCTALKEITLSENISVIPQTAFGYCSSLEYLIIPSGVKEIDTAAFRNCTALESVEFSETLTHIDSYAFCECTSLKSVTIPQSVTGISHDAFTDCSSLTTITFECLKPAGYHCFNGVTATAYYPGGDRWWTDEEKANMGGSLTWIPVVKEVAGGTCGANVTWSLMSDGNMSIAGSGAMDDYILCNEYTDYEMLLYTDAPWYNNKENIAHISVENYVISVGNYAFYGCSNVEEVVIGESVNAIGKSAFNECYSMGSILVASNNSNYTSIDGILFSKDKSQLVRAPLCYSGEYTIPDTVTVIGEGAFDGCGVTDIVIPDSVTTIGREAFYGCNDLARVTISDNITQIPDYCFAGCSIERFTVPERVSAIGEAAFMSCENLTQIALPDSVLTIGEYAFGGSGLIHVSYAGTQEQKSKIKIAEWNSELLDAQWCCSTGENDIQLCQDSCLVKYICSKCQTPLWSELELSDGEVGALLGSAIYWKLNTEGILTIGGTGEVPDFSHLGFEYWSQVQSVVIMDGVQYLGCYTLAGFEFCGVNSVNVIFTGETPPQFDEYSFANTKATVYYPAGELWTEEIRQNYGGTLTWVAGHPILEGESVIWNPNVDTVPSVRADASYEAFEAVIVDGNIVAGENYTVTQGSTVITFCEEYLYTLSFGEHTVVLQFEDGFAISSLTISPDGDTNGDGSVTDADAIYLLYHTLLPELYPVRISCDYNGDGNVNDADAIYLLYHTLLPDLYPL